MSQFWHAHWAEDAFKPTRLQNWEVPRWHPEWPTRHCTTTKIAAHKNGRVYASFRRTDPWDNFKGTWELPLKITRDVADKLSKCTESRKHYWKVFVRKHKCICKHLCEESVLVDKKKDQKVKEKHSGRTEDEIEQEENLGRAQNVSQEKCRLKKACVL